MKYNRMHFFTLIMLLSLTGGLVWGGLLVQAQEPITPIKLSKGTGDYQLGISDWVQEVEPLGPQAIVASNNGSIYILDSLNKRIIAFNQQGRQTEKISLSEAGFLKDMVIQNDQFYLMDIGRDAVLQINSVGKVLDIYPVSEDIRQGISGFSVTNAGEVRWQIEDSREYVLPSQNDLQMQNMHTQNDTSNNRLSVAGNEETVQTEFVRLDDNRGALHIYDAFGKQIQTLYLQTKYYLGTMRLQKIDKAGNYYVLAEELPKDIPAFIVDTTLRRYTADGRPDGVVKIPIDDIYFLPQRFVTVANSGEAYFLRVSSDSAEILKLPFDTNYKSDLEIKLHTFESTQARTDSASVMKTQNTEAYCGLGNPISREQMITNAQAYLNVNWTLNSANTINNTGLCWRLPDYLSGRLGQTIAEVPYKWGGYDTIDQFRSGINTGKLAGDACTADILWTAAVGVDCSGYVSKVWDVGGSARRCTTYSLPTVSTQINWNDMAPGDIANWSTGHVMLFSSFKNGTDIYGGINAYEATSDCNWRVCYSSFRTFSYLNSIYVPRRYNNVIEAPSNQPPSAPVLQNPVNESWQSSRHIALNWNASNDDGLPNNSLNYTVEVWRADNAWRTEKGALNATSWDVSVSTDGTYFWHVKASDGQKTGEWSSTQSFKVDTLAPINPVAINAGCDIQNNVWQNDCNAPAFTWTTATDNGGIGVAGYEYQWVDRITGHSIDEGERPTRNRTYAPQAVSDGSYILRLRSKDSFGHWASWQDKFILRYDNTAPIVSLSINDGESITNQTTIQLTLSADDATSAVKDMRISNDGITWRAWQPYQNEILWTLAQQNNHDYRVYVQVQDVAGNLSNVASDDIRLEISSPIPHSENYHICQSVVADGGIVGTVSARYHLTASVGQPWGSNSIAGVSDNYQTVIGFLSNTGGCSMTDDAPDPTPVPTVSPTPMPTATPQPNGFGISINDGALYTNDSTVTVSVQAPNVKDMRVKNDGGYADDDWVPYQALSIQEISTYGNYVLPRYIFVWFKDDEGLVYGSYFDDIIYDPYAPYGWGYVTAQSDTQTTIALAGYDDISGVDRMQVSFTADLADTAWEDYRTSVSLNGSGVIYFRFADAAGNISPIYSTESQPLNPPDLRHIYLPLVFKN